jgi:hypothetical protein
MPGTQVRAVELAPGLDVDAALAREGAATDGETAVRWTADGERRSRGWCATAR